MDPRSGSVITTAWRASLRGLSLAKAVIASAATYLACRSTLIVALFVHLILMRRALNRTYDGFHCVGEHVVAEARAGTKQIQNISVRNCPTKNGWHQMKRALSRTPACRRRSFYICFCFPEHSTGWLR